MQLTRHPTGSIRELLTLAFPLMLSPLSGLFMIFCDRLFLAYYHPAAMNATVTAGTTVWAIMGGLTILASMAEVFVAQYHGAQQNSRVGRPIWQMAYFSLLTMVIVIPLSLWGAPLFFSGSQNFALEEEYFRWFLLLGVGFPLVGAFSAFYVGRGKTWLVMGLALVANGVNILLDRVLIFGWDITPSLGVPSLGVSGAAIATCLGNFFQVALYLVLILRAHHRERYRTGDLRWSFLEMKRCLRFGSPHAAVFFIHVIGWAFFYRMIESIGQEALFVAGLCQNLTILFIFAAEGVSRAAATLSGNLIGSGQPEKVFRIYRSGIAVHLAVFVLFFVLLVGWPDFYARLFMQSSAWSEISWNYELIGPTIRFCFASIAFYLLFEGIAWLGSGLLAGAGDTLYLLFVGFITVPFFLLMPVYFFVVRSGSWQEGSVAAAFVLGNLYTLTYGILFGWRLLSRRWQRIDLLGQDPTSATETQPLVAPSLET